MRDDRDELLSEIGAALDVEPGAGFEPRVLAHVENSTPRAFAWMWPVAAAGAVGIVVAGLLFSRQASPVPTGAPVVARRPADVLPVGEPSSAALAPAGRDTRFSASSATTVAHAVGRRRAASRRAGFEVVIDPEQARLVETLLAAVAEGRAPIAPLDPLLFEPIVIAELPPPAPIEIPLIRIEPLPDGRGA
jgi:hypothetical protein